MNTYKVVQEFTLPATDEQEEKVIAVGEVLEMEEAEAESLIAEGVIEPASQGIPGNSPEPEVGEKNTSNDSVDTDNVKEAVVLGK